MYSMKSENPLFLDLNLVYFELRLKTDTNTFADIFNVLKMHKKCTYKNVENCFEQILTEGPYKMPVACLLVSHFTNHPNMNKTYRMLIEK